MIRLISYIMVIFMITMILSGCATAVRGSKVEFRVMTEPTEANITINDIKCTSPCTLMLPRRPGFDVIISKEGFKTQRIKVESVVSKEGMAAAGVGAVAVGIVAVVDVASGAMNDLTPNPLKVVLENE